MQGPLRYSRNPAYVSLTMLYLGLGMLIDSAWVIGLVIPTFVTTHAGVVRREGDVPISVEIRGAGVAG